VQRLCHGEHGRPKATPLFGLDGFQERRTALACFGRFLGSRPSSGAEEAGVSSFMTWSAIVSPIRGA
jgi:hypothetical protein